MKSVSELTNLIAEFPGIGPRQARRVVQFLLAKSNSYRQTLAESITNVAKSVSQCKRCFRYDELKSTGTCGICSDESRDSTSLMIVEKDIDIEGVESSGAYHGTYFVLGGLMALARQRKNGRDIRTKELMSHINENGIKEIIIALSTTPEGDYTSHEVAKEITSLHSDIKVSLLGRGLSVGAEIEYADSETLRNALKNRS